MKQAALMVFFALAGGQVSAVELKVIVPEDANIQSSSGPISPFVLERKEWGDSTRRQKIFSVDKGNGDLMVHRRVDNGVAGSGKVFHVRYESTAGTGGKELTFRTTDAVPEEYREGLFGRFAVPSFTDEDLLVKSRQLPWSIRWFPHGPVGSCPCPRSERCLAREV